MSDDRLMARLQAKAQMRQMLRQEATAPEPLAATVSRTVQMPEAPDFPAPRDTRKPAGNLLELGQNAMQDIGDIGQGLGVMGSALKARLFEGSHPSNVMEMMDGRRPVDPMIIPRAAGEFMTTGGGILGPNKALGTSGWLQANDIPTGLQIGDQALQGLHNDYVQPIYEGNPGKIANQFLTHPFKVTTDLLPVAQGAGNVARAAGQIPAVARAGQAAGQLAGRVANSAPVTALREAAENIPILQRYTPAGQAVRDAISRFNGRYVDRVQRDLAFVEEAWNKIPRELRGQVVEAGEMRNQAAYNALRGNPKVAEFWRRANALNQHLGKQLEEHGALTPQERLVAQYGPAVRSKTGRSEEWLHTTDGRMELLKTKASLDRRGIAPVYFGLMTDPQVRSALKLRGNMFGKGPDLRMSQVGRQVAQPLSPSGAPPQPRAGFGNARTLGERIPGKHNNNAFSLTAARYAQGLQYMHLKDFFRDVLNNPHIQAAGHATGEVLDVHKFFEEIAQQAGVSPQSIQNALTQLPPEARLSASVVNALRNALPSASRSGGSAINAAVAKVFGPASNVFKIGTLGFDPMFVAMQGLQTAMVAQVMMNRGVHPRELAATMMAYSLAFDKKVRDKLPRNWFDGLAQSHTVQAPTSLNLNGNRLTDLMNAGAELTANVVGWMPNKVFGTMSEVENYFRAVAGTYKLLKEIESSPTYIKGSLTDAFNFIKRTQDLDAALASPQAVHRSQQFIEKWMGKYDALTSAEQRGMKALVPFWLWMMHSYNMTKAMAVETPWKTAMMARIAKAAPEILQNDPEMTQHIREAGGVPLHTANGEVMLGPNGRRAYMLGANMTPFTQTLETIKQGVDLMTGGSNPHREGLPALTPVVPWIIGQIGGTNPQTGEKWNNPNLNHAQGRQYLQGHGTEKREQIETPRPNILQYTARTLLPRQEDVARTSLAYPNQPSDFTGLAPNFQSVEGAFKTKAVGKRLQVQKNWSPAEMLFNTISKMKPTEQSGTVQEEKTRERKTQVQVRKAERKQKRSQHDATWIETMLQGQVVPPTGEKAGPMLKVKK